MGDVKGAARDTNWLYHRKHLYHYEYKSVQYTGSRNVLDLLTTPSDAMPPRALSINPIHPSYPCYNYYMFIVLLVDFSLSLIMYLSWLCISGGLSLTADWIMSTIPCKTKYNKLCGHVDQLRCAHQWKSCVSQFRHSQQTIQYSIDVGPDLWTSW